MTNHQAMTIRDYLEARHFGPGRRQRTDRPERPDESRYVFHQLLRNQKPVSGRAATSGLTLADYMASAIASRRPNTVLSAAEARQSVSDSDHLSEDQSEPGIVNEKGKSLPRPVKPKGEQADLIDRSIKKAARKYDLAPKLIKAIIRAESNFQVDARSPAGAQGLMQLMPGTAKELGVKDSFDIDQNIDGGSRYLRQMLDRYSGNLRMALSAYNAGPGNVDKFGGRVPFAETRQYVDRVLRYSRMIA